VRKRGLFQWGVKMTTVNKLKNALTTIGNAKQKLKQAANDVEYKQLINLALKEMEEAEEEINRAIKDIK